MVMNILKGTMNLIPLHPGQSLEFKPLCLGRFKDSHNTALITSVSYWNTSVHTHLTQYVFQTCDTLTAFLQDLCIMQLIQKPGNAAKRIRTHREMTDKTKCHLTLPLRLLIEPATILFSRVPVLDSRGSQLPLIRLHDETELVSGS